MAGHFFSRLRRIRGAGAATSALRDYESEGAEPPTVGELSIVLDSNGRPRALVRVDAVEVRPFCDVDADHAAAEGEGDRSLAYWRHLHRRFFAEVDPHGRGFADDMPLVLERFSVLYARPF